MPPSQAPLGRTSSAYYPLLEVHLLAIPERINQHLLVLPLEKLRRLIAGLQNQSVFVEAGFLLVEGLVDQKDTLANLP